MELFKYEIHTHTAETSKCSKITATEIVQFYKKHGYSGLCITDHFLNGNTTVPKDLPWAERIELFCRGFKNAFIEGKKSGIDVFFGWEYSYRGTDILTYGLDKEWLLKNPDLLSMSINEYCDFVHKSGGFLVQAHPFREASYIEMIRLLPRKVDGVEVLNASSLDFENRYADRYADDYNLLKVAGSDNHKGYQKRLAGIQLMKQADSVMDLFKAIRNNKAEIFVEYPGKGINKGEKIG